MCYKDFAYKGLMKYFEEISSIPRPSFHEEKIAEYLCNFARERGLYCYCDERYNVLIKKDASKGREGDAPILLQGHTDMVCEKNEGVEHDFLQDGLKLYEENGWLRAKGTTLGADNGDAVAAMLYILDGADGELRSNPPIECLFTVSEEVGLEGAKEFDYSKIKARRMINMDSADESQIICGCAGGQRIDLTCKLEREETEGIFVELSLRGLFGGHSGEDIHRHRANANKLMGRILQTAFENREFKLDSISGGSKDNAIPRECRAVVAVDEADDFISDVKAVADLIKNELCYDDSGFELTVSVAEKKRGFVIDIEQTRKVLFLLSTVQNGIFAMSSDIDGMVEFSRNLGVIETRDDKMIFVFMSRSAKQSQIDWSYSQLRAYAQMLSMDISVSNEYPGWDFAKTSEIRKMYFESFCELYGKEPEITAIHAGLECGIIKSKVPQMDIISCGPVVVNLHSPDEAMNLKSFERFFAVIKNIIEK